MISYLLALVSDSPWQLRLTGGFIIVLALWFAARFVLPALGLVRKLARIREGLEGKASWSIVDLRILFGVDPALSHLWKEFYETLHEQKEERNGRTISNRVLLASRSIGRDTSSTSGRGRNFRSESPR